MGVIMKNKVNYTGGGSGGGGNANEMTLTMAEYLALTEEQRMDGTTYYITDGVSTKEIQPVIYSEEEREIGVWIDGKPLYQKTFSISNPPASSVVGVIDVSSLNIEVCIIKDGYFKLNDGYSILAINEGFEDRGWCHFYNNEIRYLTKYTATEVVITICYTKTTDIAGSGIWTPQGVPAVHYSTNEQVVGTWIDGKTLYERTIFTNPTWSNNSTTITLTNEICKNIEGGICDANGENLIPFGYGAPNEYVRCYQASNVLAVYNSFASSRAYVQITIRYTKTS